VGCDGPALNVKISGKMKGKAAWLSYWSSREGARRGDHEALGDGMSRGREGKDEIGTGSSTLARHLGCASSGGQHYLVG